MAVLKSDRYIKISSIEKVKRCPRRGSIRKVKNLIEENSDIFAKVVRLIIWVQKIDILTP